MVCPRCVMAVEKLLNDQEIAYDKVRLGAVELPFAIKDQGQMERFRAGLINLGFDIIDDHKTQLVNQVKQIVIKRIRADEHIGRKTNFSEAIVTSIPYTYNYISQIFSESENTTLEKFIIAQKIERAKELLSYDELSLNQIADKLAYSSTAHLSTQFKKVTGMSPSEYKKLGTNNRKNLDSL